MFGRALNYIKKKIRDWRGYEPIDDGETAFAEAIEAPVVFRSAVIGELATRDSTNDLVVSATATVAVKESSVVASSDKKRQQENVMVEMSVVDQLMTQQLSNQQKWEALHKEMASVIGDFKQKLVKKKNRGFNTLTVNDALLKLNADVEYLAKFQTLFKVQFPSTTQIEILLLIVSGALTDLKNKQDDPAWVKAENYINSLCYLVALLLAIEVFAECEINICSKHEAPSVMLEVAYQELTNAITPVCENVKKMAACATKKEIVDTSFEIWREAKEAKKLLALSLLECRDSVISKLVPDKQERQKIEAELNKLHNMGLQRANWHGTPLFNLTMGR